jgi:hypothetical protein
VSRADSGEPPAPQAPCPPGRGDPPTGGNNITCPHAGRTAPDATNWRVSDHVRRVPQGFGRTGESPSRGACRRRRLGLAGPGAGAPGPRSRVCVLSVPLPPPARPRPARLAANWPPRRPNRLRRRPPTWPRAGWRAPPCPPPARAVSRSRGRSQAPARTSTHGRPAAGPPALAPRRDARAPHARRPPAPLRLSGRLPGQWTGPVRLYTYSPTPLGRPDVVQSFRCGNIAAGDRVYYGGAPCTTHSPIQSGPLL